MRIYLTNLGMYNEGSLHGMWLKLPITDKELQTALVRIVSVVAMRNTSKKYYNLDISITRLTGLSLLSHTPINTFSCRLMGFSHRAIFMWRGWI